MVLELRLEEGSNGWQNSGAQLYLFAFTQKTAPREIEGEAVEWTG
jgi:hypothetical protein